MTILKDTSLHGSIRKVLGIYSLGESLAFLIIARLYSFSFFFFLLFLGVQFVFHGMIYFFLILNSSLFFVIQTKEPLTRVNGANKITLIRITMLPFLLFLILALRRYPVGKILLPLMGLTFLTDLMDGYIARVKKEGTFIGKLLDSISDYLLLGVVAIGYYVYEFLPVWLFWLILFRLFIHSLGMMVLCLVRKKLIPQTTILGKVAVAVIMALFVIEPLTLLLPGIKALVYWAEIAVGILLGVSLIDKGLYFVKGLTPREPLNGGVKGGR
jgi:phosphatidylglycerophosphate synthase